MADDLLQKIVSLAKRRGFIFQSSEIYGGLKSAYDYGPLGAELKRNIAQEWWRSMVHEREDIVGIDASIVMHPDVWRASGHLANFTDPLVDCMNCKARFRPDKQPKHAPGSPTSWKVGGKSDGAQRSGVVGESGVICPQCGSPELSGERKFNLMFRTSLGPVDPFEDLVKALADKSLPREKVRELIETSLEPSSVYLRPETAQAMFVQFQNVQQSLSMKVPFGIAQIGKSFRNEVITERFIFRTCEFEQMEMEYFVEPGTQIEAHRQWVENRLSWWRRYLSAPEKVRGREYAKDELAFYADACVDIEYQYPWGWDELEGIASRTDYDLTQHETASGTKLGYLDQTKPDPKTGKVPWRYLPYVIEPAAGLTRAVLMFLIDAYTEIEGKDADGEEKTRVVLKLHPRLAPYKAAILPLTKKDGLPEKAREIVKEFSRAGVMSRYDEQHSIGKRYARHDEIGTPYCITVDHQTLTDRTVTIRDRDTTLQERISASDALTTVARRLERL